MSRSVTSVVLVCLALGVGVADAQDHWTEGPAWACSSYRTLPGQFEDYMLYLREFYLPMMETGKQQGLIIDHKVFVQDPTGPDDWDVLFCTLFPNFGAAMDYNAEIEAKWDTIAAEQYKTDDEDKQREMIKPRFEMRTFLGSSYIREVSLRPLE